METPKRLSMTGTLAAFSAFYRDRCRETAAHHITCLNCVREIHRARGYMLLHDELHGDACAGPGRALRMDIPFCPRCETRPAEYGCIHMPASDMNLPSVREASRAWGVPHPLCRAEAERAS